MRKEVLRSPVDIVDHVILSPRGGHLLRSGGVTLRLAGVRNHRFLLIEAGKETLPFCFRGCLWPADPCLLHAGRFPSLPWASASPGIYGKL